MCGYQIFTDATADIAADSMAGLPPVEIIPMQVGIGGRTYDYGPNSRLSVGAFYALQRGGCFASTSQINPQVYRQRFEPCLAQGRDVLYLCFSSGLSGTIESAEVCIRELREDYPERKIVCVDTLCASVGQGFLVREAARLQGEGFSLDQLVAWVNVHRLCVCHWFTVDSFLHLKHGGRVSAAAAAVGTVLQIKPMLHVDAQGRLAVAAKPRGNRQAAKMQIEKLRQGWMPELGRLIYIGHGDCPERAQALKAQVLSLCPDAQVDVADIGPVIGAHTGPDMLALIYFGSNR